MTLRTSALVAAAAASALLAGARALAADPPAHPPPTSASGDVMVGLCDGRTSLELKGVKDASQVTPEQARAVADLLMEDWKKKNPDARWDPSPAGAKVAQASQPARPGAKPPTASSGAAEVKKEQGANAQSGHTYGSFSERDQAIWRASTEQFVKEGHRVFHDAKAMGGTVAISCDMCHPDASNTHPETYPKYQVQLGRVALLRDMINWCIQNPVRGKPLADDDPRLRAMEAYIYAQRKGTPLEYGKH